VTSPLVMPASAYERAAIMRQTTPRNASPDDGGAFPRPALRLYFPPV